MTKRRPMTESEWRTSESAWDLLHYLQQHRRVGRAPGGRRRLRLFCCACCRSVWEQLEDERSRQAVEVSERFADGAARKTELEKARAAAERAERETGARATRANGELPAVAVRQPAIRQHALASAALWATATQATLPAAHIVALSLEEARAAETGTGSMSPAWAAGQQAQARLHATLVRDIFGDPFRSAACDPTWLTHGGGVVPKLARAIYEDRAFDRLPVLADALEDAGCADGDLLAHCRGPWLHARGCWAVDFLLGKA